MLSQSCKARFVFSPKSRLSVRASHDCDKHEKRQVGGFLDIIMTQYNLSEFTPICGIYKITNIRNERVYIGKSNNINHRWFSHVADLKKGKHSNKDMLRDFQKMGVGAFVVEVIEECAEDVLPQREWYHMTDYHDKGYKLYNVSGWGRGSLYAPDTFLSKADIEYAMRGRRLK